MNVDVGEMDNGISLHALSGKSTPNAFKIKGTVGRKIISILINSGSTNSFIDEVLVKELQIPIISTFILKVTVANGDQMCSGAKCEQFKWIMQGRKYVADLRVLALEGCDVVSGLD